MMENSTEGSGCGCLLFLLIALIGFIFYRDNLKEILIIAFVLCGAIEFGGCAGLLASLVLVAGLIHMYFPELSKIAEVIVGGWAIIFMIIPAVIIFLGLKFIAWFLDL